ncbi:MAG: hypothetical protein ACKVUS_19300 [Saprospiraceae bacterium]
MTEFIFQVARPQDLDQLLQLAQRLGISYAPVPPKAKTVAKRKALPRQQKQMKAFEELDKLRLEFQKYQIPAHINISELIKEMYAA